MSTPKQEHENHTFNVHLACKLGTDKALLLQHFDFFTKVNSRKKHNFNDGYYWSKNTAEELLEWLPYFNERKIYRLLESLITEGYLLKENYNPHRYEQNGWYALTDKYYSLLDKKRPLEQSEPIPKNGKWNSQKEEMQSPKMVNAIPETSETITDTVTDTVTYSKNIDDDDDRELKPQFKKIGFEINTSKNAERESQGIGKINGHNYFAFSSRKLDSVKKNQQGKDIPIQIDNGYWLGIKPVAEKGFGIAEGLMDLFLQCKIRPEKVLEIFKECKTKPNGSGLFLYLMNNEAVNLGHDPIGFKKSAWKSDPRLRR